MSDCVIRGEDGWVEISDLMEENLSGQIMDDLWTFLAENREQEALDLLDAELADVVFAKFGFQYIRGIRMLECPREGMRTWIKR